MKPTVFPLDFFRFQHTEKTITGDGRALQLKLPLWIVGVSPFETEITEDQGHVVHLEEPKFIARWTMNEENNKEIPNPAYHDEDIDITIHDVIPLSGTDMPTENWLVEAACAVGYTKGLIAIVSPEDIH